MALKTLKVTNQLLSEPVALHPPPTMLKKLLMARVCTFQRVHKLRQTFISLQQYIMHL